MQCLEALHLLFLTLSWFLESRFGFLRAILGFLKGTFSCHVSSSTAIKASSLISMPSLIFFSISFINLCKDRWINVHWCCLIVRMTSRSSILLCGLPLKPFLSWVYHRLFACILSLFCSHRIDPSVHCIWRGVSTKDLL